MVPIDRASDQLDPVQAGDPARTAVPGQIPLTPDDETWGRSITGEPAPELPGIVVPSAEIDQAVELAMGTMARGFDGDAERLRAFASVLHQAVPAGTVVVLRGSTVGGRSFRTGAPHDAAGPGTSDLDVVLVGDAARDLFSDEARLVGGINTLPLSDETPWVAPALDPARRRAQSLARRPVSIQAMAGWFLELRARLQAQPYVILVPDA